MAFIAVRSLPDGTAQTLGVVRAVIDPDNVDAEFAIIVRSDLKGQGLGHLLMRKMIGFLSSRGTLRMIGYVLRENSAMQELVRTIGFAVDAAASDADALHFALTLSPSDLRRNLPRRNSPPIRAYVR
jgi:acetyltransferase